MAKKATKLENALLAGDCRLLLPGLADGSVNLAIADSPYNYGVAYDKYDDHRPFDEYLGWTEAWLCDLVPKLHKHGSLWLFYPDELVSFVDVFCQKNLGLHRRGWVVWAYGFGVACQKNFSRSHTHLLYYTRTKTKFTFNTDAVRVPSNRALVYNDDRASPKGKAPDNTWVLTKAAMEAVLPPDADTWYLSRICGTYKERQAHVPNQLPLPLVERIVLACSNPGDLVVDPFLGSGTTAVAAATHGRRFWGCDISEDYVAEARKRVLDRVVSP